jgi:hypothetical protein
MKKWIDASEIKMVHELPTRKLRQTDKEMRETPISNKCKDENKKT